MRTRRVTLWQDARGLARAACDAVARRARTCAPAFPTSPTASATGKESPRQRRSKPALRLTSLTRSKGGIISWPTGGKIGWPLTCSAATRSAGRARGACDAVARRPDGRAERVTLWHAWCARAHRGCVTATRGCARTHRGCVTAPRQCTRTHPGVVTAPLRCARPHRACDAAAIGGAPPDWERVVPKDGIEPPTRGS